ncbi:MAG: hypothetical protein JWL59_4931 [Chthoniobacteraceae bacterium]|nr:hypothetical protein [Chthoniobacteraceae bacterium]
MSTTHLDLSAHGLGASELHRNPSANRFSIPTFSFENGADFAESGARVVAILFFR